MKKVWEFFENLDEYVYVTDVKTNELIYMNRKTMETYGYHSLEQIKGKKCYQVLQNSSMPCKMCNNKILQPEHFQEWRYYNPILKKYLLLKDTLLHDEKTGKDYRIEMAMDVGEEVRQGNVIENFQNLETLINEGLRIALLAPTPDQSIEVMLEYLGKTLHGDRTYIFEKDERGYDNNTYEWVADGVVPEKEELQNLPPEVCAHWYKKFQDNRCVVIHQLEDIREKDPILYEVLEKQSIHSLVVVPLYDNGKVIAFFGLDNIAENISFEYTQSMLQSAQFGYCFFDESYGTLQCTKGKNAAFYTNKFIVNEIMGRLPVFNKDEIRILEPSVGAGSFIPFLFKQYENVPHVILDVVDIDPASLEAFSLLLNRIGAPSNFTINQICHDFVTWQPECRYDLAVGNPPFSKLKKKSSVIAEALKANANQKTNNLAAIFLEKCIRCSDCVSLVLNKNILASEEYAQTRDYLRTVKIDSIIDFGRYGFTGVSIETMCMIIYPRQKPKDTTVYSMKYNVQHTRSQEYLTDPAYPSFVIYRDEQFDEVAKKLRFDVFTVFRDRQITKANTVAKSNGNCLWVIKARNIDDDGLGITHIPDYDEVLAYLGCWVWLTLAIRN